MNGNKVFLEKLKQNKLLIASLAVFFVTLVAAVVGLVLLPQKMFVQLFSETDLPETGKVLFLSASVIVVAISSAMCFFAENIKKWLALESVLAIASVGCIVYNLIVLC